MAEEPLTIALLSSRYSRITMAPAAAKYVDEVRPTFVGGYIRNQHDMLLLTEACLQGKLYHIPRGPRLAERQHLCQSGYIFVFEENSSGITEWEDGLVWKSRVDKDGLQISHTENMALVKKSGKVMYHGITHYVVSYYKTEDWLEGNLKSLWEDPKLSKLSIRRELKCIV